MSQILFGDDVRFKNGIVYPIQVTNNTTYNITNNSGPNGGNDYGIIVSNTNQVNINLPSDDNGMDNGRIYNIIDGTGTTRSGGINDIIINPCSGITINNEGNTNITGAYNSLTIMYISNTSDWRII